MVDRNAQALADQLLALPSRDRARIAEILLASLEGNDPGAGAAWDEEIEQRKLDLENGRVKGISGEDVFAEVERRLRAWKSSFIQRITPSHFQFGRPNTLALPSG